MIILIKIMIIFLQTMYAGKYMNMYGLPGAGGTEQVKMMTTANRMKMMMTKAKMMKMIMMNMLITKMTTKILVMTTMVVKGIKIMFKRL